MKPAIVAIGYNRPNALLRLLDSVNRAIYDEEVTLIISLDYSDNHTEMINIVEQFEWKHGEKIIRSFEERQGLRNHVLQCGDLSETYGSVIILEDDLVVSPSFYIFAKQALEFYENDRRIAGVALYSHEWNGYADKFFRPVIDRYDVYFGQFSITWGQCWTKKSWQSFKHWYYKQPMILDSNPNIPDRINHWGNQSWGRYYVNYMIEEGKYYVIPRFALSTNCSEIGEHANVSDADHQVSLLFDEKRNYNFAKYDEGIFYDIFFENQSLNKYLDEKYQQDVVIDLNGTKRSLSSKRYILSTRDLPYRVERSFGLQLRPIDMNIILNVPGNVIRLYDLEYPEKKSSQSYFVKRYDVRGQRLKDMIIYCLQSIKTRVFR